MLSVVTPNTSTPAPRPESLPAQIDLDLVQRFDKLGPRYTSYPTADRFVEAFDAQSFQQAMRTRLIGAVRQPLSLYVHLPFCNTICFYCGCNKVVTRDKSRAARYLHYLGMEIGMQAALAGDDRRVRQMHWGGGTPTFLSDHELRVVWELLRSNFEFTPEGEYAIEIDPRSCGPETIRLLAELGFNRASFGVQDFDPAVQRAVNRIQPYEMTRDVIDASRASGFKSLNIDLIFGGLTLRAPIERQFAATAGLMTLPLMLHYYVDAPTAFAAVAFLAGAAIAPSIACQSVLVSRLAPSHYATEAFTWSSTFIVSGLGAGIAVGGWLIESAGPKLPFLAGAALMLAVSLGALALPRPRAP